jgi:RHS repeat-associated protein
MHYYMQRSVTTPMRGTMTLDYDRRGNTIEHPDTTWVLSDVTVQASLADDGISDVHRTYEYGTARYDFLQREDLGFDWMAERELAEDGTTLRSTVHEYLNDSVFGAGLEYRTTLYDGDVTVQDDGTFTGTAMQRTLTDWRVENLMTGQPLDTSGASANQKLRLRAAPLVNRVSQIWYDDQGGTGQRTSIRYDYDDLGNPIVITDEGDITNDGDDVVARIRYSDCTISEGHGLRAQFGCADGAADAPHENPDPDDPDDPWDDVDTPAAVAPEAAAPYWSPDLCATWTSVPVIIEVRDANGDLLRYRDGSPDVCDNTSVTHLKEMVEAGPTLADSTFAVTRLAYDEWGSYNRIAYPPDEQGNSYAVYYVYDQERHADVAEVTDLSLHVDPDPDLDQVEEFIDDPTDLLGSGDSDIVGITSSATFDGPTGRVSTRTDASGNVTTYDYDAFSRTSQIDYPDGGSVEFEYAPTDAGYPYAVARHSDEFNADTIDTATFVDGMGDLTGQKRDATFFVSRNDPAVTGWAVAGASLVDELGRTTKQWYPTPQLTGSLTDYWEETPDEDPIETRWDALDRTTKETASNGSVTTTSYGFGSIGGERMSTTTVTDPLGRASVTYKDAYDNIRAVDDVAVDTGTHRTTYDVDSLGQVHSVRSAPSEVIQHTYDLVGQRLSTTTPDGGETEYSYDLAGNLATEQTAAQRADGDTLTHHTYAFGHLVSTEYTGDPTLDVAFTWGGYAGVDPGDNGAGRVVGVVDSARDQTLGYDENGHLDSDTTTMLGRHPNNGPWTTGYDYDFLGRLSTVDLPDGETVVNDYDHGGQLSQVRGVKACTDLGSLTTAIDDVQTTITVTENPTSDLPALPFTIRVGGEQMLVTDRTATADPTQWTYTVVRGVNGTVLTPTNTAHKAGASVSTDAEITCHYRYLDRREYDEFGTRAFQSLGNDVWTRYTRDADTRRLAAQRTMSPAAPNEIQDLHYTYDLVGNLKTADNNVPTDVPSLFGGPVHQKYDYDGRYRIKHAEGTWDHAPKTRRLYTYDSDFDDASGNMTSARQRTWEIDTSCKKKCKEDVIGALTYNHSSITYATGAAHRFDVVGAQSASQARDYSYDESGNVIGVVTADMIREITVNAAGQMGAIVDHNPNNTGRKVTSYRYDYNGNLALEIKEQGQTSFVNPWVTVRNGTMWKHIWAGTDRLATKFSQQDSYEQKIYYLHKDLQGSTNVVTDRVGKVFQHHEYVPTGQAWVDEASTIFRTPYQFGGGYVDEDHDLVNFGQRWYEPGVQAFTSVDPALTSDPMEIVAEPTLRSSYAYANNNPLTNVDSTGQLFSSVHVDPAKVLELVKNLQIDGKPLSATQRNDVAAYFAKHNGVGGRVAMFFLKHQERNEKLQAFAESLDTKPMLEFEFENGKLSAIKLGLGIGKRKKFDFSTPATGNQAPAPSGTANPAAPPAQSQSGTTQPAGGPPATSGATGPPVSTGSQPAPTTTGTASGGGAPSSTTNVVKNSSTSAGGGNP